MENKNQKKIDVLPIKMGIFNSYVCLPEGMDMDFRIWNG
jgi:hypothetical protein